MFFWFIGGRGKRVVSMESFVRRINLGIKGIYSVWVRSVRGVYYSNCI